MAEEQFFWAEKVAAEITRQKRNLYVCEGGWSPSGHFHIGNSRPEIFTPYAVYLKLLESGFKARQVLVVDDFDPIDKIPAGIPVPKERESDFIGVPYELAESPFKGYKSWSDFFTSQVKDVVGEFGVKLEFLSSFKSYKSGERNELIKFSLDNSRRIVETWNRVAGTEKPLGFLPVTVLCEKCKKIMFTEALSWDGKEVSYRCKSCGFTGSVSPFNGNAKLHWRVHWVANWIVNDVAFESGGKDHFSKGGSVDVGRALISEVFGKSPPCQTPTEFVQLGGAKISGSVGNVITLKDWVGVASPELLRFMFFSYKPNTAINFSFGDENFALLHERFERAERIFYGTENAENEKIAEKIKESYALASIGNPPGKPPVRVPFSFAVLLGQLFDPEKQLDEIIAVLAETGRSGKKLGATEKASVRQQVARARNWVEKFAPEKFRICFLEKLSQGVLSGISKETRLVFSGLVSGLRKAKSADEIQQLVYNAAKGSGVQPKDVFRALYLVLLGKESGPKLGSLIIALGKERCVKRLEEAA